ncbi:Ribose-5-phosphate isomerase A [Buchnera aphidicola (Eriosoma grossulariae)]|uniref:ribose-5-phosphate isomerase RpiA n=1 Tax=Buchnera aphidicola TaxID=9 RepID=UPI003463E324
MLYNHLKKSVAHKVLDYITPNSIIGIGTGTTVSYFIQELGSIKKLIKGTVSSSISSTICLNNLGIPVFDLNEVGTLSIYIDSADEVNNNLQMIKGGGEALTKEKILASVSKKFICIVDESKQVNVLGQFPLPVEIIPMASSYIISELNKLGGEAKLRKNVITDNGNLIVDVYNLNITDPLNMEQKINSFPGVVTVGIFAQRKADILLVGTKNGIKTIINN